MKQRWFAVSLVLVSSLLLSAAGPDSAHPVSAARPPVLPLATGPALAWNTFLGGTATDQGSAVALDGQNNIYVAGRSTASWGNPINSFAGGAADAFVAKLNSSGQLLWHTFLGGPAEDAAVTVAVDGNGNVYVGGDSWASWGTPIRLYSGGQMDGFVAKLNSSGGLVWNTFLGSGGSGSTGDDHTSGIVLNGAGDIFVAGESASTWGSSPVNPHSGYADAFVAKLNNDGQLQWHTFLGGGGLDSAKGIHLDGSGNVYFVGASSASWGVPVHSFSGSHDMLAAKLNSSGVLQWHTFLGGGGYDIAQNMDMDGAGNVFAVGYSPAPWGWGTEVNPNAGAEDILVAKLNNNGQYQWHTFMGSTAYDSGAAIAVGGDGYIYVVGFSAAAWGTPANPYVGANDVVVARLGSSGARPWHTFLGGSADDVGAGIALDGCGNILVTGFSDASWGIPLRAHAGGRDTIVTKISPPYKVSQDGYRFENRRAHTSWEIFRDTFGADNVEWPNGQHKLGADRYYHNDYKCDGRFSLGCTELGAGANCDGMAASSMLLYKGWADPSEFLTTMGVTRTIDLPAPPIENDFWNPTAVTDFIVRYQGYQRGGQVRAEKSAAQGRSLTDTLTLLKNSIDGGLAEPLIIHMIGRLSSGRCVGHAVTPFAYESDGRSTYVYVYDPNWPQVDCSGYNDTVTFTPNTDTWYYDDEYRSGQSCGGFLGLFTTPTEIEVIPLSTYRDHPVPPWSDPGMQAVTGMGWYLLQAGENGSLMIQDAQQRVVGNRNGQLALEIPGSYLDIPMGVIPNEPVEYPERYVISSTTSLTVSLIYSDTGQAAV